MELRERAVLLTGASGGIGRALALRLAKHGARLALFARGEDALRGLAAEVERAGGKALVVPGDARKAADASRAVAAATDRFGGLDALVNCAGVMYLHSVAETTDEEILEMIEVNLLGVCRMTRAALPALRARPGGAIVNIASFAGRVGAPYYSYYNASKFGLVGLTEAWRRELGPLGLRVTLIVPAAVETPLLERAGRSRALGLGPAGTVLQPERVAKAVEQALRRHPAEIYLPARNHWLAVLNVMMPGLSDRILNALYRYPGKR